MNVTGHRAGICFRFRFHFDFIFTHVSLRYLTSR